MSRFLDSPTPLAFAHRGGAADGLENSLAAFERCVRLGYRYLETDVHTTADGVALAFHDADLDRVTDRPGRVAELPYRAVAKARIGGREPIPRLDDLLAAWPEVKFNLDVKAVAAAEPLAEAVRRTGTRDRVCLASFSAVRLALVKRLVGPGVCTSLPTRAVAALRLASYSPRALARVRPAGDCVQIPVTFRGRSLCDPRLVAAAHARGLQVHVWTLDTEAEIDAALALGVDGVMTDQPETLKAVLTRRGCWTGG
ncbi:MAG: glycerophosphodiester phosphodiesterase [Actinomycetota bacterium]|nr:glycerophosphodiester phosphodiesterase [Actinomycetota bacterium]